MAAPSLIPVCNRERETEGKRGEERGKKIENFYTSVCYRIERQRQRQTERTQKERRATHRQRGGEGGGKGAQLKTDKEREGERETPTVVTLPHTQQRLKAGKVDQPKTKRGIYI
jgi:hypothetical protein